MRRYPNALGTNGKALYKITNVETNESHICTNDEAVKICNVSKQTLWSRNGGTTYNGWQVKKLEAIYRASRKGEVIESKDINELASKLFFSRETLIKSLRNDSTLTNGWKITTYFEGVNHD